MGRYFGTDGIRGPAEGPLFGEAFLQQLSAGIVRFLRRQQDGKPLHVVIGRDPRSSGERIASILASELSQYGIHLFEAGIAPTPAISKAVIDLDCDLGIVITASHNPPLDNGVKLLARGGGKLTDQQEAAIEQSMDSDEPIFKHACSRTFPYDAVGHYLTFVRSQIHSGDLKGWHIAVDTANGATACTAPRVLRELGAEVHCLGDQPDGHNINCAVGSEHPEAVSRKVLEVGAHLGLAFDGDGDRLVLIDERGSVVDGDALLGLIAQFMLQQGSLARRTVVATVMSNLGLDQAMENLGGTVVRTPVGDRHVAQAMTAGGFNFGGESSGHIIFRDLLPSGDGLLAATQLLRVLLMTRKPLSQLAANMPLFPQRLINLPVRHKPPLESIQGFSQAIRAVEQAIPGRGRVLVRYSGTESKIRLLAETPDPASLDRALDDLERVVRQMLPVL